MKALVLSLVAVQMIGGATYAGTVYSNSAGGDLFTNAGTSTQGQAVTSNGDVFYNNTRNNGRVGIRSNYARSGNGSAFLETTQGPGGASSKADIEVLASGTAVSGNYFAAMTFGTLSQLTSLRYEWYRDSASTNSALQHPVVRVLIDADGNLGTLGDRGGLVFEIAYNGFGSAATDTWVSEDVLGGYNAGAGANLWSFGADMGFAQHGYSIDFSDWVAGTGTVSGASAILGFSMGVGSGWGPFQGAVDNLVYGIDGVERSFNFETLIIPLPYPMGMAGVGILAVAGLGRRRFGV